MSANVPGSHGHLQRGGADLATSPTFILDFQVHRAQHLQHAVHDAGVCGSHDRLARQKGQGGYSLHLVHLGGMKSSFPSSWAAWLNGKSEGSRQSLALALERRAGLGSQGLTENLPRLPLNPPAQEAFSPDKVATC